MSRLYDDKKLSALPVQNIPWGTVWTSYHLQKDGNGVILEGTIKKRSRVVICAPNGKVRYYIFNIEVHQAHMRVFDAAGNETEPNFSQTQKVRTGFLHSSYKTDARGKTDRLSDSELNDIVSKPELNYVKTKIATPNTVPFWMEETALTNLELLEEDTVRLKTYGNGPFIENVAKVDRQTCTVSNYAGGEQIGTSWTDKVMSVKQQDVRQTVENEGVDDDEWDD